MDQRLLIIPAAFAALALVLALSAHRRLGAQRRSLALLESTFEGETILEATASYINEVRSLEQDLLQVASRQESLFAALGRSIRNLGVVRFDAFEDMGGRLSFSAAFLDDHGTGMVITSINGRSESRVYAKEIEGGGSEHNLSAEEQRAISEALGTRTVKTRR